MAAKKKRHEMALRIDDLMLLRSAARVGRATMVRTLRDQKAEMQRRIRSVELLDDVLQRLDVQIMKASDALGFELPPESSEKSA